MTFLGFALETLMKSQDTQKNWEAITEAKLRYNFSRMSLMSVDLLTLGMWESNSHGESILPMGIHCGRDWTEGWPTMIGS